MKYKTLEYDDTIKKGDWVSHASGPWTPCLDSIGGTPEEYMHSIFRRPIKKVGKTIRRSTARTTSQRSPFKKSKIY